jgi:glycosyltransferase involved in cell wall biosynthesis
MEKSNTMNENIKISIVVPVYNLQDCIERCISSILSQTYKNLEILIVDDGSSDNSRNIISRIAKSDQRIIPIFKENGGVTSARLAGIKKATGDWIGFVDGDDEIESDMYEMLLNNAVKYGADISHCGYQMVFSDGRINYFHNSGCLVQQDKLTGLKDLLAGSLVEPGLCNKLFHKTLFHSLLHSGMMHTDIKINEDLLMNYILFSGSRLSVFEDVCKYHYIVRENSATRSKLNEHKIFDPIRVKKLILESCDKEIYDSASRAYISTCINVYNGLMLEKGGTYSVEEKKVWKLIMHHKKFILKLGIKQHLLADLILLFPIIYKPLYRLYVRYIQHNKYE